MNALTPAMRLHMALPLRSHQLAATQFRIVLSEQRQYRAMSTSTGDNAGVFAGTGAEELRNSPPGKCSKDTPLVPREELPDRMKAIPAWTLSAEQDQISRSFVARNFLAALDFFRKVAEIAEEANHHPDLHLTSYRNVEVVLSTHAIGGISQPDLIMAAKIDALPVDYSPKWLQKQVGPKSSA